MSKYDKLWYYLKDNCLSTERLSFDDIYRICGAHVDTAFMEHKHECERYGLSVMKIDMKSRTILFSRNA